MTHRLWFLATTILPGGLTLLLIAMGCHGVSPRRTLEPQGPSNSNQVVSQTNNTLAEDPPQTEATSNKLKCSISIEEQIWSTGKPALVSFVVENISGSKLDLKAIPAFIFVLDEEAGGDEFSARWNQYWGPVDVKENRALGLQQEAHINLEKGESMRAKIDLTTLKWERRIGAVWPSHDLFTIVSVGRYQVYLDIAESEPYGYRSVGSSKVPLVKHALSNTVHVVIE